MARVVEIALFTENVQELVGFYTRVLGLEPVIQSADMAIFQLGEAKLLIHYRFPTAEGRPPNEDHIALGVADLAEASTDLDRRGVRLMLEPRAYPWGRSAYLRDPDGRLWELSETPDE